MSEDTRLKTPAGESAMEPAPVRAARVAIVDAAGAQVTSFGGGTQYTEGDVDASITGTVVLMEGAGNALVPLQGTAAAGLLVTSGTLALETGGNLAAAAASLTVLDDWDEVDRAKVNLIVGQAGVAAGAGAVSATVQRFTLSSDDPAVVSLQLLDDAVVTDDAAFTPATTKVVMAGFEVDETATDSLDEGDAGAARITPDRKVIVTPQPHTSGGLSVFRSLDLDESEEDVKTSPGCLYKLRITNRTSSVRYVKLYNDTAGNVLVGTTAPLDTIPIPANASDYTVLTESFGGMGLSFTVALSIAATTGFADNDTGAPGANDIIVSAYYK